jgi:hypothetical protein
VSTERSVDWEQLKRCLAVLHRESKPFLARAVLIGGAACWFYRVQLRHARDPDFHAPEISPQTESRWLSKDIDFTGIFSGDAMQLLPQQIVTDASGRKHLEIEGVRLGFAQVGVTFDPEEVLQNAQLGSFRSGEETVEFLVIDPVRLYREKQALSDRRNQPNDLLHCGLMREYLCWRLISEAERFLAAAGSLPVSESKQFVSFVLSVEHRASELFSDERLKQRLSSRLTARHEVSAFIREHYQLP